MLTPGVYARAEKNNKALGVYGKAKDLGGRDVLAKAKELFWYPSEVDVSIRPGWFYHEDQDSKVKSLKHLTDIYFQSVGYNSVLLLNIPPDTRGLINEADVNRLKEFRAYLDEAFADNKAVVTLDTVVTDELKREGMARDFVRLVQNLRKEKDFNISDRIRLCWQTDDETLRLALKENEEYIKSQVLVPAEEKVADSCAAGTTAEIEGAAVVFDVEVLPSLRKGA